MITSYHIVLIVLDVAMYGIGDKFLNFLPLIFYFLFLKNPLHAMSWIAATSPT